MTLAKFETRTGEVLINTRAIAYIKKESCCGSTDEYRVLISLLPNGVGFDSARMSSVEADAVIARFTSGEEPVALSGMTAADFGHDPTQVILLTNRFNLDEPFGTIL